MAKDKRAMTAPLALIRVFNPQTKQIETVGKLKYYIKIDDTSISETKSIIDLASQSNGF